MNGKLNDHAFSENTYIGLEKRIRTYIVESFDQMFWTRQRRTIRQRNRWRHWDQSCCLLNSQKGKRGEGKRNSSGGLWNSRKSKLAINYVLIEHAIHPMARRNQYLKKLESFRQAVQILDPINEHTLIWEFTLFKPFRYPRHEGIIPAQLL